MRQDGGNSAENSLRNVCEGSVGDHGCCQYCSRRTWRRRCRIHFSDEISLRTARSFVGQSAVQISTIFGEILKRLRHTSERTVYMYMHSTGTYTVHIARGNLGGNLHTNVVRAAIALSTSETANKQSRPLTATSEKGDVGVLVYSVVCES